MENKGAAKQVKEDKNLSNSAEIDGDKIKQVENKTTEIKEKVSKDLLGASDKLHEKSDSAQEFLDAKTNQATEYAHETINKVNELGHRAADALGSTSEYVRNIDLNEARERVKQTIKSKPEIGIVAAGVIGFFIGLLIGKRR